MWVKIAKPPVPDHLQIQWRPRARRTTHHGWSWSGHGGARCDGGERAKCDGDVGELQGGKGGLPTKKAVR